MKTITGVLPRTDPYAVTESSAAGYRLKSITCNDNDSTGAIGTRTASIRVAAGETVRCTFVNTKLSAAIEVVKSGPAHRPPRRQDGLHVRRAQRRQLAAARRQGHRQPLRARLRHAGQQDRRRPGRRARGRRGVDLHLHQDRPDATAPARPTRCATSPPRPARTSRTSRSPTPTSTARTSCTRRSRSRRRRPQTAQVGDTIGYKFDVTNPGDIGLAVTLSDPRCDAGTINGPQKVTGDSDNSLEPGELWRYTCTHKVTASDPDPLPNTVHVTGKDPLGGPAAPSRTRTRPRSTSSSRRRPSRSRKPRRSGAAGARRPSSSRRPVAAARGCAARAAASTGRSARTSAAGRSAA